MRFKQTFKRGLKNGLDTSITFGKIMLPVILVITVLEYTPVIDWIVFLCTPVMKWIGLSGEAAIPFVLANFLHPYAGIGAILTLELTVKEVFILAVMISFSHSLAVESAIAVKVGIRLWVAIFVRLALALVSALLIHWIWQGGGEIAQYGLVPSGAEEELSGWLSIIGHGLQTAVIGVLQLAAIIIPLMIAIEWLKDMHFLTYFNRLMRPFTRLLGLSPNTSTSLGAGLIFGLAFGAGVILQEFKEEHISKKDMYLLFIFLVACHAVIEDTLIFIPLGIPVLPLLLIRLVVAIMLTMLIAYIWNRMERKKNVSYEEQKGVQHEI